MARYRLGSGGAVDLGRELANAGEGRVLDVAGRPELVAKVFHTTFAGVSTTQELDRRREALERKRAKVAAMVKHMPEGWRDPKGHIVLAWPRDVLLDGSTVAGFVMPKIDLRNVLELHQVSNPSDRANPMPRGPQWARSVTFRHLAAVAANLATAVQTVHGEGAVIGDFNERNVLVSNTTRVTLVDCDSMQFRRDGRTYLCEVGRPEYTAPELQGRDLRTTARTRESDLFALAVHIYALLFDGAHPFQAGDWSGRGERPGAVERIRRGYYSGGPRSPVKPMRTALPMSFLPSDLLRLFERALGAESTSKPSVRPSASEWRTALMKMMRAL